MHLLTAGLSLCSSHQICSLQYSNTGDAILVAAGNAQVRGGGAGGGGSKGVGGGSGVGVGGGSGVRGGGSGVEWEEEIGRRRGMKGKGVKKLGGKKEQDGNRGCEEQDGKRGCEEQDGKRGKGRGTRGWKRGHACAYVCMYVRMSLCEYV